MPLLYQIVAWVSNALDRLAGLDYSGGASRVFPAGRREEARKRENSECSVFPRPRGGTSVSSVPPLRPQRAPIAMTTKEQIDQLLNANEVACDALPCFVCGATSDRVLAFAACASCAVAYPLCAGCLLLRHTAIPGDLPCPTRVRDFLESVLLCEDCGPNAPEQLAGDADHWYAARLRELRAELLAEAEGDRPPHEHLH